MTEHSRTVGISAENRMCILGNKIFEILSHAWYQ